MIYDVVLYYYLSHSLKQWAAPHYSLRAGNYSILPLKTKLTARLNTTNETLRRLAAQTAQVEERFLSKPDLFYLDCQ